ncbi:phage protein [Lacticaseibacillus paracasei]|uniref:hypothetical protein n=1 Tax=Lacticaseibacillus paracasei TaxID=1597 RepID=UPI001062E49F|nr:hypothetical protein [Lacticaseibacillus paracasei]TEA89005.1 phage protein [Lacticaseibacillus paracasei]TEA91123.1 phage protein [Lacticaseibacillus paracasei]
MSNETKRDVFETFADECAGLNDEIYKRYLKQYDAALPDDLPVIPEAVGEILRSAHGQTDLLDVFETAKNGHKISETLAWIIANQNTFARAWVLGVWRVEETGEIVKLEAEK